MTTRKGLCQCGCGQRTELATVTRTSRNQVAGEPLRYVLGHNSYEPPSIPERFHERVEYQSDTCWLWTGGRTSGEDDYPQFHIGNGQYVKAHRWAYEHFIGPIPDGLTLDHLCRNTMCVNPDHLEPVTAVENVMRGNGACVRNARKTHCKRGHPFDDENTYHWRNRRICRACQRRYRRERRERESA